MAILNMDPSMLLAQPPFIASASPTPSESTASSRSGPPAPPPSLESIDSAIYDE
jgi:hypothetical protein